MADPVNPAREARLYEYTEHWNDIRRLSDRQMDILRGAVAGVEIGSVSLIGSLSQRKVSQAELDQLMQILNPPQACEPDRRPGEMRSPAPARPRVVRDSPQA